jgi:hypothetical protein
MKLPPVSTLFALLAIAGMANASLSPVGKNILTTSQLSRNNGWFNGLRAGSTGESLKLFVCCEVILG